MMAAIFPIMPAGHALATAPVIPTAVAQPASAGGFSDILAAGLKSIDNKVSHADAMVEAYAKGDAVPVHQVTLALEQARLAVELAVQVRTRLVETYREFMNMQL